MPTRATKNPMNVPINTPVASEMSRASIQLMCTEFTSTTKMHIVRPLVTPAERSISPRRITKTSAMPSMTSVAAWVRRLAKLRSVRKYGTEEGEQHHEHDET